MKMSCYSCLHSMHQDGRLVCGIGLKGCPGIGIKCQRFVYEPGTDEQEREQHKDTYPNEDNAL